MIISDFKARCIATVKRVQQKRIPVLLTIRGQPVAEVRPLDTERKHRRLGVHQGLARIADIPIHEDSSGEWSGLPPPRIGPA